MLAATIYLSVLLAFSLPLVHAILSVPFVNYSSCHNNSTSETSAAAALPSRALHAITCDTRSGYKSAMAMKVWNGIHSLRMYYSIHFIPFITHL